MPQVRLIDSDGSQIGIKARDEALEYAWAQDLDLVEVAPDARPPVCRVMDYSKYKYEQEQKAKLARKHQSTITIKEIKLRPKVGVHDYETKRGHVIRFLKNRDKVKVTIMFRGRETTHPERGRSLLLRLAEDVKDLGVIESEPLQDGRNMVMMLGPVKQALPKKDDDDAEAIEGPTSLASLAGDIVNERASGRDQPAAAEPRRRGGGPGRRRLRHVAPPPTRGAPAVERPQRSEDTTMPKMKANSSAAKRIKVTAGGKIKRRKGMESHNRGKMSAKRRRKLHQDQPLHDNDRREALRLLGMK